MDDIGQAALPESLLASIDQHARPLDSNRSAFIEAAARALIAHIDRDMQDVRDMEIINREADRLNREAEEILSFQVIPSSAVNCIESLTPLPDTLKSRGYLSL